MSNQTKLFAPVTKTTSIRKKRVSPGLDQTEPARKKRNFQEPVKKANRGKKRITPPAHTLLEYFGKLPRKAKHKVPSASSFDEHMEDSQPSKSKKSQANHPQDQVHRSFQRQASSSKNHKSSPTQHSGSSGIKTILPVQLSRILPG
jgi:hypothetical protein